MENRDNIRKRRSVLPAFPLIVLAFLAAGGLVVMLLWNAVVVKAIPAVLPVNYPQAVGLLVLCRLLFGGFRGRPGPGDRRGGWRNGPPWRQRMERMTPEERERFRAEWKARCNRPQ